MYHTTKNNVVLKQECHSPKSLWGIFRIRNARGVKPAKGYEEEPRALRAATKAGYSGSSGFTLLELLVVILIIGILAVIALPQYQKAVEKSKATVAQGWMRQLVEAQHAYYLEHGEYAKKFDQLDVNIPFTGTTKWLEGSQFTDVRSTKDWSLQLEHPSTNKHAAVFVGRLGGNYKGGGWSFYFEKKATSSWPLNTILCTERYSSPTYGLKKGDYCQKLFRATVGTGNSGTGFYQLK